jgi:hypothetical protein
MEFMGAGDPNDPDNNAGCYHTPEKCEFTTDTDEGQRSTKNPKKIPKIRTNIPKTFQTKRPKRSKQIQLFVLGTLVLELSEHFEFFFWLKSLVNGIFVES